MTNHPSIWMAIDLMRSPSSVKLVRAAPLPNDVSILLRIAAGDETVMNEAVRATGNSRQSIHDAAGFYIEQILLFPEADSYRVLGAPPEASNAELRRNMALLMRWLHPDRQNGALRSVFTTRVTRAWNDLKTEEKRAAYNRSRRNLLADKSSLRKKRSGPRGPGAPRGHHSKYVSQQQTGPIKRALFILFGWGLR